MHVAREPIEIAHAAIVSQIKLARLERHDAIDTLMGLSWIEVRRRRRWINEFAGRGVEFAI